MAMPMQQWLATRLRHLRGWLALMRPERWFLALYGALTLLLVASDGLGIALLFPIVSAMSSDSGLRNVPVIGVISRLFEGWPASEILLVTTLFLMVVITVRALGSIALQVVVLTIPLRVQRRLVLAALGDLLSSEWSYISQFDAGQLQHRTIALPHEISGMLTDLADMCTNLVVLCAYCVLMLLVDARSAVLGTVLVGAVTLLLRRFGGGPLRRIGEEANRLFQKTGLEVMQFLEGLKQILISGGEPRSREGFGRLYDDLYRVQRWRGIFLALPGPAFTFASGIIVCALLIGNLLINEGPPSAWLGRFLIFLFIFNRLSIPVGALSQAWLRLIAKVPSYDLFSGFVTGLHQHRRVRGSAPFAGLRSAIRFNDVAYCYPSTPGRPALERINTCIRRGETVALVGPSGSGKSTFAMLLTGLIQPTSGRISVDDTDLQQIDWNEWRGCLGFVFQDAFVFDDTVGRNIEFPFVAVPRERLVKAAVEAQAHDFITNLPAEYETRVGIRGDRLSGGQRQRLSIARTLLREPDLLILDEAASNLDTLVEAALHRALHRNRKDKTVVHIAHRLGMIREVDRILVFDAGTIVAEGTHDDLVVRCQLYADLVAQSVTSATVAANAGPGEMEGVATNA